MDHTIGERIDMLKEIFSLISNLSSMPFVTDFTASVQPMILKNIDLCGKDSKPQLSLGIENLPECESKLLIVQAFNNL